MAKLNHRRHEGHSEGSGSEPRCLLTICKTFSRSSRRRRSALAEWQSNIEDACTSISVALEMDGNRNMSLNLEMQFLQHRYTNRSKQRHPSLSYTTCQRLRAVERFKSCDSANMKKDMLAATQKYGNLGVPAQRPPKKYGFKMFQDVLRRPSVDITDNSEILRLVYIGINP